MADFPRTIIPKTVSPFRTPDALISTGQSGKVQLRDAIMMGREWDETFPPLRVNDPDVQALLAFIEGNKATTFTIQHLITPGSGLAKHGGGIGTPLVNGAAQTGSSLATDGWSVQTGVLNKASNAGIETGAMSPHFTIVGGGTWGVNGTQPRSGSFCASFDSTGQSGNAALVINGDPSVPANHTETLVSEGEVFYGEAFVRCGAASAANDIAILLDWHNDDGAQISSSTGSAVTPTTTYAKVAHAATAPAGTAYVVVYVLITNDGNPNTHRIDDMHISTARVAAAGDVIKVAGLNQMLRITADAFMDAGGESSLSISPPIVAGSSPADDAALTLSSNTLTAYLATAPNLPPVSPGMWLSGLTLTFRESL